MRWDRLVLTQQHQELAHKIPCVEDCEYKRINHTCAHTAAAATTAAATAPAPLPHLRIAAERILQEKSELTVAVRNVGLLVRSCGVGYGWQKKA
jgi:hypothetical protein